MLFSSPFPIKLEKRAINFAFLYLASALAASLTFNISFTDEAIGLIFFKSIGTLKKFYYFLPISRSLLIKVPIYSIQRIVGTRPKKNQKKNFFRFFIFCWCNIKKYVSGYPKIQFLLLYVHPIICYRPSKWRHPKTIKSTTWSLTFNYNRTDIYFFTNQDMFW